MSIFLNKSILILSVSACIINLLTCQDAKVQLNDISIEALGKSGKIRINKSITKDNTTESNTITLDFSSLKELDVNGTEVGKSGQIKHSFNNFAQMDFKISQTTNVLYQNLTALTFDLTATDIQLPATRFTGRVFIFNETGSISNNGESASVNPGTIKLSIDIQNWNFCTQNATCPGINCCKRGNDIEIGNYLEFVMVVKGKESSKKKSEKIYSLGGSEFILFQNIQVDGNWTTMPTGYPRNNNTEEYTFRFPIFTKTLSYDPIIQYEKPATSTDIMIIAIIAIVLVVVIAAVLLIKKKTQSKKTEALIDTRQNA
jgi:hypothetical protein